MISLPVPQRSEYAFVAPAEEFPGFVFHFAGEDKVHVAVAAEDVAGFEVDGQAEGAQDTGLQVVFEQGLGDDLVPLQLDEAGVLEQPAGRFDLLREAPLFFDLDVEVVKGEREGGVEQRFVEGDVSEFVGGFEVGEKAVDGRRVAEEGAERVAFFEGRGEGVAVQPGDRSDEAEPERKQPVSP